MHNINDTNYQKLQSIMFKHIALIKQFNQSHSQDEKLGIINQVVLLRQQRDKILNKK